MKRAKPTTDGPDYIVPELRGMAVPLASLNADLRNARIHDRRNIDAIKASLARFGQRKPLVVKRQGMLVTAGNGTLQAARELGWNQIAAVVVDEGEIQAKAFAIADNRSAELAGWEDDILAEALELIRTDGEISLDSLGFSGDELADLLDRGEPELRELDVQPPPVMTWALIGIPTVRFGEIAEQIELIASFPGVVCETVSNDG